MAKPTLLYVDDRPSTLSNRVFERNDYNLILLRRTDHSFSTEHLEKTSNFLSYYRNPNSSIRQEIRKFKEWCNRNKLTPTHFLNPSEPEQYFSHAFAKELGLNALNNDQVSWLRNKVLMKQKFRELGFQTASYKEVSSATDVTTFAEEHGWPVVVKPQEGFACIETHKVSTPEQLKNINWKAVDKWMVESYVSGTEWECCALINEGKVLDTYLSYMPARPLDIVDGAINANITVRPHPKDFPVNTNAMVQRLVSGMNLNHGYMHMEFFTQKDGSYALGETALRLAGCEIPANHGYACDFPIFDALIDIHLGNKPKMKYGKESCVGDLLLPISNGFITSMPSPEEVLSFAGAISFKRKVSEGDVIDPMRASHTCSGVVHVSGDTVQNVEKRMKHILKNYKVIQRPVPMNKTPQRKISFG